MNKMQRCWLPALLLLMMAICLAEAYLSSGSCNPWAKKNDVCVTRKGSLGKCCRQRRNRYLVCKAPQACVDSMSISNGQITSLPQNTGRQIGIVSCSEGFQVTPNSIAAIVECRNGRWGTPMAHCVPAGSSITTACQPADFLIKNLDSSRLTSNASFTPGNLHQSDTWNLFSGTSSVGWLTLTLDGSAYVQADLGAAMTLVGVATKATLSEGVVWTTMYFVQFSIDGAQFESLVDENEEVLIFTGNMNANGVVYNSFPEAVNAQFLRIFPTAFVSDGASVGGLRFDVLGCNT